MNDTPFQGDTTPLYNIKAVSRLVGLLPVTIRAWERRYGLPAPSRGAQGYRLYSAYDVRTLAWLKEQVQSGVSIRQAVERLRELRAQDRDPALRSPVDTLQPVSLDHLQRQLLDAFSHLDPLAAQDALAKAFALFPVEQVLDDLIARVMVAIGERWARREISVSVEHFATQVVLQRLSGMLANAGYPTRPGILVAACLPGEAHEIGLLSLAVMLRWRGWDVRYLGPNLLIEDLPETLAFLKPRLLLFSATRPENLDVLRGLPALLAKFPAPLPQVVVGGQALLSAPLPDGIPAIPAAGALSDAVRQIERLAGL